MRRKKFKEDHLDLYLKSTYLQRLNWLEKAYNYVKEMMRVSKKIKKPKKLLFILLFIFLFSLYSFSAKLNIPDSLIIERTLYLAPQSTASVCDADSEGRIYYDANSNTIKYCDGSSWKDLGGGGKDKSVATVIVAACDSLDSSRDGTNPCLCNGSTCSNPRAEDYTCDGTDDQQVIQQAIDSLGSSGGVIYLLEGTYNITGPINLDDGTVTGDGIDDSNKSIIGVGRATVLLPSGNFDVVKVQNCKNIFISSLKIDGSSQTSTSSSDAGIEFYRTSFSKIENIWIEDLKQSGVSIGGSHSEPAEDDMIVGNFFKGMEYESILAVPSGRYANNLIITNNIVREGKSVGIVIKCQNSIISANQIVKNGQFHSTACGLLGGGQKNIYIGNNVQETGITTIPSSGIDAYGYNSIYTANMIVSNYGRGIEVLNGDLYNIISSNIIANNKKYQGILLGFASFLGAGTRKNLITGNIIGNNGANFQTPEVVFYGSLCSDNLFSFNYIYDTLGGSWWPSNALLYLYGGKNNYLVGNFVDGVIYEGSSADTTYTQKEKITIERQKVSLSSNPATLEVATTPRGYVFFDTGGSNILLGDPANNIDAINDGKAIGDTLILEGPSSGKVTVKNGANTKLHVDRELEAEDTLTLIWNGEDWIEIAYSDN